MSEIFKSIAEFFSLLPTMRITDIIDILLVAFLIYEAIRMIRTTSAARIARAIIAFLLLTWLTGVLEMRTLNWILERILEISVIALIIMFQPELRRLLERVGGKSFKELLENKSQSGDMDFAIAQTVSACELMSQGKIGALIVFERRTYLEEYFKSGTVVDAKLTSELLRNIFFPKAMLHDGAVIIRGGRIVAAACILQLSDDSSISRDLGTRHRAALGISETTDCVSLIVSEETGIISAARDGKLTRYLDEKSLTALLSGIFVTAKDETLLSSLFKRREGKPHEAD